MKPRNRIPSWLTSPTASAILHRLACKGPATIKCLVADVHAGDNACRVLVKQMLADRAAHVARWISSLDAGGHPSMVIALGRGMDAAKPSPLTKAENYNRWASRKRAKFGADLAKKMIRSRRYGGADTIVIDGKTVYQRRAAPC